MESIREGAQRKLTHSNKTHNNVRRTGELLEVWQREMESEKGDSINE